ncbi:hypothetical protein, partial [Treponema pedis]|uniref:hypothetical protein n=1 Tax=Treponema pedis TaxID=409322 RepID=UPI001CEF5853
MIVVTLFLNNTASMYSQYYISPLFLIKYRHNAIIATNISITIRSKTAKQHTANVAFDFKGISIFNIFI